MIDLIPPRTAPAIPSFSWRETAFATLLMLAFNLTAIGLLGFTDWPDTVKGLLGAAALHAGILAGAAVILAGRGQAFREAFNLQSYRRPKSVLAGLLGCAAVIPVTLLLAWLSSALFDRLGFPVQDQIPIRWLAENHSRLFLILFLVEAVVLAPLAEELFFRGFLLSALLNRLSAPVAVGLSSLLFAAFHCHAPTFLPLFAVAVGCAVTYLITRSLAAPIVMHTAYNLVNLAWLLVFPPA